MRSFTRRLALKLLGLGSALIGGARSALPRQAATDDEPSLQPADWSRMHDRVWLGADYWANPMEDWRVVDGAAECVTGGGNRNIQLLTHQLRETRGDFEMSVRVRRIERGRVDGGAGFRVGVRCDIDEFRANCFARGGIDAGLIDGQLVLGDKKLPLEADAPPDKVELRLFGRADGREHALLLIALDDDRRELGRLSSRVASDRIVGNVALVNNFAASIRKRQGARYRFERWTVGGDAFDSHAERRFGPILWSMYSLSDSRGDDGKVLKISALTGPLSERDDKQVEFQTMRDGRWRSTGRATLDTDAWTATLRIPRWDAGEETPYRWVYRERHRDGSVTESFWSGKIKAEPVERPLRLAALTCQNDYAFPYEPVAANLARLDPDMLYFSGDQLYENHGGFGIVREPAEEAILNYLRKFYMFGWAFREAMRDRPTLCIPDDHDVFQGNIWGEGGAKMDSNDTSSQGGYREPARMVNVVHRTCAGHHPDLPDDAPVQQGISVYFGDVVYGGVGFAVVADRQFKSGPQRVDTGGGRADHVEDPDFDTSVLDKPGLELLGSRQERFLERWGDDWRGHDIKVLLSQTVFAGVATHHGRYDGYLKADLDSGGWPRTARDRALRILAEAKPLHINGDQHMTSLVQYGVDRQRDSCWSFCVPAIAAGYPRWWRPDELGMSHENRPSHGLPNTGEYVDGLGNRVYVYAVGNPEVGTRRNRYELAHQKGSGFGLVTIDPAERTYRIEAFRFLCDATDGNQDNQFPGWPLLLHQ